MEIVNKTVLPNGIRVITEHIESVRSAAVGIWVKTGSRNETHAQSGITHFIEHMLFKGTENRTAFELAHTIESAGGYLNAFTSTEYTCYYVRCLDTELKNSLSVLADMIRHPLFPSEEIEKEKKVVIEEMKMYRDNPDDYLSEEFVTKLFSPHPLGRPIIGYEDTVNSFKRDNLMEYMSDQYRGPELIVAASGNVRHQDLVEIAESLLGEITKKPSETDVIPVSNSPSPKLTFTLTKDIEQTHFLLGRKAISISDENRYKLLLLNNLLSGGMSARLHQNIREKYGYCYSIHAFSQSFSDSGMFGVYTGTDASYLDHVRDLIKIEFDKLGQDKVSDKELGDAKRQLKGKLLLAQESMNNRMMRLGKNEIYFNTYVTMDELVSNIDAVTASEVQSYAGEFLNLDHFNEGILKPEE